MSALVKKDPHRQSRRDCRPHHPRLPRDGPRHGRRLFRVRSRGAARPLRRRGVPDRPERAARELPAHRPHPRRGARARAPTPSIPGYGFLAENEDFAAAVRDAGLTFIGPTPEAIALMGSKTARAPAAVARRRAGRARHRRRRSAPTCPTRRSRALAESIGYPLLVKAVAGGGGKGMRTVTDPADLAGAVRAARSEAGAAFGDAAVYLERRLLAAAPHRSAAARRPARHGAAVRRARVLDSAPAPEGRRRNAVAGGDAGDPRGDDRRRGGGRARGRLHQRRHDRVPARRGRPLLLPRDEHAAAGRASDHRDGDRRRSGALADSHRARRAARPRSRARC